MNPPIPPCATTGVGSLPHLDPARALALSLSQDLPFLPELPRLDPDEFMVPAALRGLEPGVPDLSVLRRFLAALPGPTLVKVQMVGPTTLGLERAGWLERRARDTMAALREAGHRALFVIDEPVGPGPALPSLVRVLREQGAEVGLHCCGNTDWGAVLELDLDVVSLDARLSLEALLSHRRQWLGFVERGGSLALGIIPTNPGARYEVAALCAAVTASLRAATPSFEAVLSRALLTPACGLANHSVADAERIISEVRQAQALLLRALS